MGFEEFSAILHSKMEIKDLATKILLSPHLEDKLFFPEEVTDLIRYDPLLIQEPSRLPEMQLSRRSKGDKLPSFQEHGNQDKRAICLHRFAGHELLAVEIMAYVLLAFPDAPKNFRMGVLHTLKEEQIHVRLYQNRMLKLGLKFGDLPLYRHFWNHVSHITSPLDYISMMSLTFEMANLDFAPIYGKSFAHFGDQESASLMGRILEDEIRHVSFGWKWLNRLKEKEEEAWDAWTAHLPPLLNPKRAKGFYLIQENRQKAQIPQDWIDKLQQS